MIVKRVFVFLFLLSATQLVAQSDKIDSLLNDLVFNQEDPFLVKMDDELKYDFLYTGVNYSNNSYYAGREIGDQINNFSGHVFYYNYIGFFLGASGLFYNQLTPNYNNATFSAGYNTFINKKKTLSFRTSYSRYEYFNPDTSSYYPHKNNFNLGLSFRKKWLGARVSHNVLFGDYFSNNLSTAINLRFTILRLGKFNKIYTMPELSAFFSSETITITGVPTDKFGLLNTQLSLPISIALHDFDIEANYYINFPSSLDETIAYPVSSFFSVSVNYLLPIIRKKP